MNPALLYLLKVNGVLLLVAGAYFGLLRQLTFFALNRVYLVAGLLFAAVYPVVPMPALFPAPTPLLVVMHDDLSVQYVAAAPTASSLDWQLIALGVYAAGAAVLLVRLFWQMIALWRLHRKSTPAVLHGHHVRLLTEDANPFSFGQTIYLNPARHPAPELLTVLCHEQVHVRQGHTLDVLLAQVMVAAAWCNPAAWLLRRALLDNLEYLADRATLQTGLDRRLYQYSLLRLSQGGAQQALASPFTFSTLKNRVVMMNMPLSSSGQLARYIAAGPLVLAITLAFTSANAQQPVSAITVAPTAEQAPVALLQEMRLTPQPNQPANLAEVVAPVQPKPTTRIRALKPAARRAAPARANAVAVASTESTIRITTKSGVQPLYYVDGELLDKAALDALNPEDIASVHVFKGEEARQLAGEAGTEGVIIIITKQNQDSPKVQEFNAKMGIAAVTPAPTKAAAVPYLAPPALVFITKHYPGARLIEVSEARPADDGPSQYKALVAVGRRPVYLLFDRDGQFISELPYKMQASAR